MSDADAFAVATARAYEATLLTGDPELATADMGCNVENLARRSPCQDASVAVDDVEEAPTDQPERKRPPKVVVGVVVGILVGMVVANNVGDALTTSWAEHHPAGLIALNSRNRILVLTTNQLGWIAYYSIATLRLLASDPLFYLLGRWYGDGAIRWVEKKSSGYGQSLRWLEKAYAKAAWPLVFLMPNNPICLFAGAAGMSVPVFFIVNIAGTFARLFAIRVLGATFDAPINDVLDFFGRYRIPLLVASVALVLLSVVLDRLRGGDEIESLRELTDEQEGVEDA